jgi:hypothetical protein
MSLIESLLMDLKMSNDLRAMDDGVGVGVSEGEGENVGWNSSPNLQHGHFTYRVPLVPTNGSVNDDSDVHFGGGEGRREDIQVDEDFSNIIAKAVETSTEQTPAVLLASSEGPSLVSGLPINQEAPLPLDNGQLASNIENGGDNNENNDTEVDGSPFLDNLNDIKAAESNTMTNVPNSSLESMTAKELHSLAKQRRVPGESKMNRAELIEVLRSS